MSKEDAIKFADAAKQCISRGDIYNIVNETAKEATALLGSSAYTQYCLESKRILNISVEQTHTARVSVGLQGGGYTGLNKAEEWEEAGGDEIADDFMDKVKKVTWEEKAEEWEDS